MPDNSSTNIERKKLIVGSILGDYIRHGDEFLYHCPNPQCSSSKKKLSINYKKDKLQCWVCGYRGKSIYGLVSTFGSKVDISNWEAIDSSVVYSSDYSDLRDRIASIGLGPSRDLEIVPVDSSIKKAFPWNSYISLANMKQNSIISMAVVKYLLSRGITRYDVLKWQIGFCVMGKYSYRVIIPSFNVVGKMNYFITRSYLPDAEIRYWNPKVDKDNIIFNEFMVDWSKPVILVEGVFDAINFPSNAVPLLGSSLGEKSLLFRRIIENKSDVILALDSDAKRKELRIQKKLTENGIGVYRFSTLGYNDVGEMPKKLVQDRLDHIQSGNGYDYLRSLVR